MFSRTFYSELYSRPLSNYIIRVHSQPLPLHAECRHRHCVLLPWLKKLWRAKVVHQAIHKLNSLPKPYNICTPCHIELYIPSSHIIYIASIHMKSGDKVHISNRKPSSHFVSAVNVGIMRCIFQTSNAIRALVQREMSILLLGKFCAESCVHVELARSNTCTCNIYL